MKVLSAMTAVEHLLATEVVRPGDTLVDSSSGIYAHALALACHRYDLGATSSARPPWTRCCPAQLTLIDNTTGWRDALARLAAFVERS